MWRHTVWMHMKRNRLSKVDVRMWCCIVTMAWYCLARKRKYIAKVLHPARFLCYFLKTMKKNAHHESRSFSFYVHEFRNFWQTYGKQKFGAKSEAKPKRTRALFTWFEHKHLPKKNFNRNAIFFCILPRNMQRIKRNQVCRLFRLRNGNCSR